jgi:hypothetical protein
MCFGCYLHNSSYSQGGATRPAYHAAAAAYSKDAGEGGLVTLRGSQYKLAVFGGRTDVLTNAKRLALTGAFQRRGDMLEGVPAVPFPGSSSELARRARAALGLLQKQQLDHSRHSPTAMALLAAQRRRNNGHHQLVELATRISGRPKPGRPKRKCTSG